MVHYDQLDPLSHPGRYAHAPAITFECGADDTHVPPDGALRFRDTLAQAYPAAGEKIRVTLHPGIGHLGGAGSATAADNCLSWLTGGTPAQA